MSEKRTSRVKGRASLIKTMKKQYGTTMVSAQVGMKSSAPVTSKGGKSVFELHEGKKRFVRREVHVEPGRSEGENVVIMRTQAKRGRNAVFTDASESDKIQRMWTAAINKYLAGDTRALERGARKIGKQIVKFIQEHIRQRRRARGKMKPVGERTAKIKKARWGDQPPLIASGQLIRSLRSDFRMVKK